MGATNSYEGIKIKSLQICAYRCLFKPRDGNDSISMRGFRANIHHPKCYVKSTFGVCEKQRRQNLAGIQYLGSTNLKKMRRVQLFIILLSFPQKFLSSSSHGM